MAQGLDLLDPPAGLARPGAVSRPHPRTTLLPDLASLLRALLLEALLGPTQDHSSAQMLWEDLGQWSLVSTFSTRLPTRRATPGPRPGLMQLWAGPPQWPAGPNKEKSPTPDSERQAWALWARILCQLHQHLLEKLR